VAMRDVAPMVAAAVSAAARRVRCLLGMAFLRVGAGVHCEESADVVI
jgi:hypothetical protein